MSSSSISAAGLIPDAVGAILLGFGVFFKGPASWVDEGLRPAHENGRVYLGLAVSTADAQVGGALLAAGFALQFCGNVGVNPRWLSVAWGAGAGATSAIVALIFLWSAWRPRAIRRATALWIQTIEWNQWRVRLDEWGMFLDKDPIAFVLLPHRWGRRNGEGIGDYGRRFFGARRWERLTKGAEPPLLGP